MTSPEFDMGREIFIRVAAREKCMTQTETWEELTQCCLNAAIHFYNYKQTLIEEENNADDN